MHIRLEFGQGGPSDTALRNLVCPVSRERNSIHHPSGSHEHAQDDFAAQCGVGRVETALQQFLMQSFVHDVHGAVGSPRAIILLCPFACVANGYKTKFQ